MEMIMKICNCCKRELPTFEFSKNKALSSGLDNSCRDCKKKKWASTYKREDFKAQKRLYDSTRYNSTKKRIDHIQRTYNISEEELSEKMNYQRGCCEVCGKSLVSCTD